jgi:hypothetical protein
MSCTYGSGELKVQEVSELYVRSVAEPNGGEVERGGTVSIDIGRVFRSAGLGDGLGRVGNKEKFYKYFFL